MKTHTQSATPRGDAGLTPGMDLDVPASPSLTHVPTGWAETTYENHRVSPTEKPHSSAPVQLGIRAFNVNDIFSYQGKLWIVLEANQNLLLIEEYVTITIRQLERYEFPENWKNPERRLVTLQ